MPAAAPTLPHPSLVAVVDANRARAMILEQGLIGAGVARVVVIPETPDLMRRLIELEPDLVIIDLESLSRDEIEHMCAVSRALKRPVAMFVDGSDATTMRRAIEAGVSAYVADGFARERILLVGGSAAAAWKAELLAATGCRLTVVAAEIEDEMRTVAADPPAGTIAIERRAWTPEDLAGKALAIGAIEDEGEGEAFAAAARAAGVPVNVVNRPALCDFAFGSIVNRSPLVIGISTDGAAPVFGQAVRAKIEGLLPSGLARWVEAAKAWRPAVQHLKLSF